MRLSAWGAPVRRSWRHVALGYPPAPQRCRHCISRGMASVSATPQSAIISRAGRRRLEQDTATAAKYFNRALTADPDNPTMLERAFLLDVAAGDVGSGAKLAQKVAATSPDNRVARLILAIDAIKHRHYQQAIKTLDAGGKARPMSSGRRSGPGRMPGCISRMKRSRSCAPTM